MDHQKALILQNLFRTEITPLGKRETAMAKTLPCFFPATKEPAKAIDR
jgi:hypothetical protein